MGPLFISGLLVSMGLPNVHKSVILHKRGLYSTFFYNFAALKTNYLSEKQFLKTESQYLD
ncbi:MAG: hypothetical protein EA394_05290 [Bacteroidia bacterium]|nr:MAG: hypothetical protein EA394_05290 [Bacteroidia bacterium]